MVDAKGLVQGGETLKKLVMVFGSVFLTLVIITLVMGVLINTGTSGDITLTNTTNNTIAGLDTTFDTQVVDNATSASGTTTGLVVLVVILILFGGFLAGRGFGGSKGGIN